MNGERPESGSNINSRHRLRRQINLINESGSSGRRASIELAGYSVDTDGRQQAAVAAAAHRLRVFLLVICLALHNYELHVINERMICILHRAKVQRDERIFALFLSPSSECKHIHTLVIHNFAFNPLLSIHFSAIESQVWGNPVAEGAQLICLMNALFASE